MIPDLNPISIENSEEGRAYQALAELPDQLRLANTINIIGTKKREILRENINPHRAELPQWGCF